MHVRTVHGLGTFGLKTDLFGGVALPVTYKVKMRKLFLQHNNWLLQWRFPDERVLIKRGFLTLF